ncbi:2,3-bisphosphoglycerate-dependent phosphoglycerate mutase [Johnsonella ignava ATCC 51276]|jgi:2,3-bisphosphoglycerate-dependent phosphoglycerate mutase|uniref:2,3-bisphosphoglycerate-dependent phosphoglycerate mutase n=2 Tax=Johnsonella TaxID=43994 RepID=G5GJW9_9FIRM|nr:2,3-diphosphoglycerate-dependent phosphoglycerate mutase [Johnsonella ignava]EHI55012.1 2,3-bisphosphoglycerate-dependent phosphoglycerate mutase [Johnsonella ignava ATCC 51276]
MLYKKPKVKRQEKVMKNLVLIRHGESEWNLANRFTGWTDVDLSEKGVKEAKNGGIQLKKDGFDFDICYTSYLKRAIHTLNNVLFEMDREWLPVVKSWKLNERHYGALQGLNKSETSQKYGEDQVKIWRRSFDIQPPALEENDDRNPALQEQYRGEDRSVLPLTESLKDTIARVIPYYENVILPEILKGRRVLIAAHGNSLRALIMYLDGLSEKEIIEVNVPTGIPLVYTLTDDGKAQGKRYLGNQEEIEAKMKAVAAQGKAK